MTPTEPTMLKKTTPPSPDTPPRTLREYFTRNPKQSQRDFAKRMELTQSFISMLVSGERAARGDVAKRIARATGVPLDVLITKPKKKRKRPATATR